MFTGIVDHVGKLTEVAFSPKGAALTIQSEFKNFALGESIAVDGVCLTVIRPEANQFKVELSPETLKLTVAGGYKVGQGVNLERAMQMNDRFGGHWVTGHADGYLRLKSITPVAEFKELVFEGVPAEHLSHVTKKGSVTLNGVSLTVNEVFSDGFSVMLIPHTLERTNLSELKAGSLVNVEFDWMTKVIVKITRDEVRNFLSGKEKPLTQDNSL